MNTRIEKHLPRCERNCWQECRTCEGAGVLEYSSRFYDDLHAPDTDEVRCEACEGTGYRFGPQWDVLHSLADWRLGCARKDGRHTRHYNSVRAAVTKRRTLGWMAYAMCERAIRASVAFEELRRAWRAAA